MLGHSDYGESSRLIQIFTRELGLVTALAQGVRESRSKLRFNLQDFSVANFDLIRGRELWRVTGATPNSVWASHFSWSPARLALGRIFSLLRRLIHGEEANQPLYQDLVSAAEALSRVSADQPLAAWLNDYELLLVARVLKHLGYRPLAPALEALALTPVIELPALLPLGPEREVALAAVNQALAASHL